MLTDEFADHPKVTLHHMACSVDSERQRVVYLYTLGTDISFLVSISNFVWYAIASGASEKSHGMNVALVAGVPRRVTNSISFPKLSVGTPHNYCLFQIVTTAERVAKLFQVATELCK